MRSAFVLEEAVRHAVRWRDETASDLRVTVNVSARQTGPEPPGMVADALVRFDMSAEALCLEMTESAVMEDPEGALEALRELKDLGVSLASDEFGLGTSALGIMGRSRTRTCSDRAGDGREARMLRSLGADAAQGFHLGRPVSAEGVEELLAAASAPAAHG